MRLVILAAFFSLGLSAQTVPQVPRKSKEFTLIEPSGKQTLLSSQRGKVVVIQFLSTTCPHCQAFSVMLTKLTAELGPKGFVAWPIAFDEADAKKAAAYKQQFAPTLHVGYTSRESVISFLGFTADDRLFVPQIAVIDRQGKVRAQTSPAGEDEIRKESKLRMVVDGLLKESAAGKSAPTKAAPSTADKKPSI